MRSTAHGLRCRSSCSSTEPDAVRPRQRAGHRRHKWGVSPTIHSDRLLVTCAKAWTSSIHSRSSRILENWLVQLNLPELAGDDYGSPLALADYFERVPHRFFDRVAYAEYLAWLKQQDGRSTLTDVLRTERARLDRAYRSLAELNEQIWHDELLGSNVDQLRFFDRSAHPAYLRLVEGPMPGTVERRRVSQ